MAVYKALSLKQPWATLLVHGRKTIEIRRWYTRHSGLLLIHAARVPDQRPEAWECLPDELRPFAQQGGGIIGVGTLTHVKVYRSSNVFVADAGLHLNHPSWFEPPGMFGFCFHDLRVLPFRRYPGNVRLFNVEMDDLPIPEVSNEPRRCADLVAVVMKRFRRLVDSLGGDRSAGKG